MKNFAAVGRRRSYKTHTVHCTIRKKPVSIKILCLPPKNCLYFFFLVRNLKTKGLTDFFVGGRRVSKQTKQVKLKRKIENQIVPKVREKERTGWTFPSSQLEWMMRFLDWSLLQKLYELKPPTANNVNKNCIIYYMCVQKNMYSSLSWTCYLRV